MNIITFIMLSVDATRAQRSRVEFNVIRITPLKYRIADSRADTMERWIEKTRINGPTRKVLGTNSASFSAWASEDQADVVTLRLEREMREHFTASRLSIEAALERLSS